MNEHACSQMQRTNQRARVHTLVKRQVRTEMLRFRAAYPQQSHSLAAAVPTQAEVQLKQLAQVNATNS